MFFISNPIGKTLGQLAIDTKEDVRDGYIIYVLNNEDDTSGVEWCESKRVQFAIDNNPQLRDYVVKYANAFFDKVILRVIKRDYSDAEVKEDILRMIYEQVKKLYGDCVSVNIFINCEGIEVTPKSKPFTIGTSMQRINGEFLERLDL